MLAVKAIHFEQGTLFQYHNIQFGEADAAFAEFDSMMATDLVTAEPSAQQLPIFEQPAQEDPVQATPEPNTDSDQDVAQPELEPVSESPSLNPPATDRSSSDAVKEPTPVPDGEVEPGQPLRPNMFDTEE